MSNYTKTNVVTGDTVKSDVNVQLGLIEAAIATKLDNDGDLDLDSNDLLNVGTMDIASLSIGGVKVVPTQLAESDLPLQTNQAGKILQTNGLIPSWVDAGSEVNVKHYGASTSATGAANKIAFNLAIAAAIAGDTILIPADTSAYTVDITGGRSDAVMVNKKLSIKVEGAVIASTGAAIEANPATIFNVSVDDVVFIGSGSIAGDGTINSVNTGTAATMPSLVYVSGDEFTFTGVKIVTPYKVGIHLNSCVSANIHGARFTGGPTAYSDTAYFAVRADAGGRHSVDNNQFYPDANGGMYVNCLFMVSSDNKITNNVVYRPYEKLAYITGDGNLITGNRIIGNVGTIPGTNQQGTVGVVIRCDGANNKIHNNFTEYGGGAAARAGGGNEITNNKFLNAGSTGAAVFGATSSFDNTIINGNTITCGNLAGVLVTSGILVSPGNFSNRRIDVSKNIVQGFALTDPLANIASWGNGVTYPAHSLVKPASGNGRYYSTTTGGVSGGTTPTHTSGAISDGGVTWTAVAFEGINASIQLNAPTSGGTYEDCTVEKNKIPDGERGIGTNSLNNSSVSENSITATTIGIREDSGAGNQYRFNRVVATTPYSSLSVTSPVIEYLEGDWIPVISDGTNNATMGGTGANNAKYVRIGRQVTVTGNCVTTALGSVSGAIRITGLPFTSGTGVGSTSATAISFAGGLEITLGQSVVGYLAPSTNFIALYLNDATTGNTTMQHSEWSDNGNVAFSMTYFV